VFLQFYAFPPVGAAERAEVATEQEFFPKIPVTLVCLNRIVRETFAMDFSEIYRKYAHDVYCFSLYLSGSHALAEDLTAETFARALCGPADIRFATVKAYLFAIARNTYRDSLDRQSRLSPIDEIPDRADPAPAADCVAEHRQTLSAVLRAIQRLPEQQREALVLSLDVDLRYDQIGAILGCSEAAVKVRIHRARLHLKSELETRERKWRT